jgi:hypothetical protein
MDQHMNMFESLQSRAIIQATIRNREMFMFNRTQKRALGAKEEMVNAINARVDRILKEGSRYPNLNRELCAQHLCRAIAAYHKRHLVSFVKTGIRAVEPTWMPEGPRYGRLHEILHDITACAILNEPKLFQQGLQQLEEDLEPTESIRSMFFGYPACIAASSEHNEILLEIIEYIKTSRKYGLAFFLRADKLEIHIHDAIQDN